MVGVFKMSPLLRAIGVIGAVAALVTGITFAALQSQATLTNNTISSATADLQIKSGGRFDTFATGFAFVNVVPGGPAVPSVPFSFDLKNNGGLSGANLDIKVYAALPIFTSIPVLSTVAPDKVFVRFNCTGGLTITNLDRSLTTLSTAGGVAFGGPLAPTSGSEIANCTAQAYMQTDAFSGSSTSSNNFNLVFTGLGV